MLSNSKVRSVLLGFSMAFWLIFALFFVNCSDSGQNTIGSDSDDPELDHDNAADSDPLDEAPPTVCTPNVLRCDPDSDTVVNICLNDGSGWDVYRDCADSQPAKICQDGDCILPGDLDEEEVEVDEETDIQDNDPVEDDTDEEREEESTIVECPGYPEMVLVDDFCIDRWEAVAMEYEDCGGTAYGQNEDDFPEEFPRCVDCGEGDENGVCEGEGGFCPYDGERGEQTKAIYACSIENVLPSRYITWFRARKACLNSDKRLCSMDEWIRACEGPEQRVFPYGDTFIEESCHTDTTEPIETGQYNECVSQEGVVDQIGNLAEWSATTFIPGSADFNILGCYWSCTYPDHLSCNPNDPTLHNKSYTRWEYIGFRCCKDIGNE